MRRRVELALSRTLRGRVLALAMASATLMGACGAPRPEPARKEIVIWKQLGSWSGRGNAQTESFVGLTGSLRIRWRTTNEDPKGPGRFKLILQSAISGRALQEPVDEEGPGEGTAYAADDPRVFHIRSNQRTSIGRSRSRRPPSELPPRSCLERRSNRIQ